MIRMTKYPETITQSMDVQFSWDVTPDVTVVINTDELYLKNGNQMISLSSNTHPNTPGEKYSVDTEPTIKDIQGDPETINIIVLHSFNVISPALINQEYIDLTYSRQSKGTYYIRSVSPVNVVKPFG